jgi:hypothetical protein
VKNYNTAFYYEEAGHPNYAFGINQNKVYGGEETYVYHWELNYSGVSANGPYGTWSYTIPSSVALQDLITTSSVWNEVSSKLDTTSFSNASGTFLTGVNLSSLNDAGVNNIVYTASLPATPDANTLYLIPEA